MFCQDVERYVAFLSGKQENHPTLSLFDKTAEKLSGKMKMPTVNQFK